MLEQTTLGDAWLEEEGNHWYIALLRQIIGLGCYHLAGVIYDQRQVDIFGRERRIGQIDVEVPFIVILHKRVGIIPGCIAGGGII